MTDFSNFIDGASIDLYAAACNLSGNSNLLISPISIIYASLLVYLGSRGNTRVNFDQAFSFSRDQTAVMNIKPFADAMSVMQSNSTSFNTEPGTSLQLQIANSVFLQKGLNVNQAYYRDITTSLQASVYQSDFRTNPEVARNDINRWVEGKTARNIKDLIPSGAVDRSTLAVLVNALYFKAAWQKEFSEYETKSNVFHLNNGRTKIIEFMNMQREKFNYVYDPQLGAQYLEIPYMHSHASLLVILPRKVTGLRAVEAAFNKSTFSRLAASVRKVPVNLTLPRFKIESTHDAKELLRKIGITEMFSERANLSGITPTGNVKINAAFHKTFIAVDEKGTEAAAATALIMAGTSLIVEPETPVIFKADHPFLFAIRHNNPTNVILFIGRVVN